MMQNLIAKLVHSIRLATKWLRTLSIPLNGKIRNHLVAKPIFQNNQKQFNSVFIY